MIIIRKNAKGIENLTEHEKQHSFDNFFYETSSKKNYLESLSVNKDKSEEKILSFIENYCNFLLQKYEFFTKTEILAHIIQKIWTGEQITQRLLKSKKDGGIYNFFDKEDVFKNIKSQVHKNNPLILEKAENIVNKMLQEVYKKRIENGIKAVEILKQKGYPAEILSGEFMPIPLKNWLAVARDKINYNSE